MKCPNCKNDMVESNRNFQFDEGIYKREYFCFECHELYECTSQSGDMIEEYLEEIGVI